MAPTTKRNRAPAREAVRVGQSGRQNVSQIERDYQMENVRHFRAEDRDEES